MERKSCFRVTDSRQQAQFFAALDGLGAAGGSELVEGAGTVCLDGVFGNEKLRGDLAIAQAAGDQGEDFELASRDAEGLLAGPYWVRRGPGWERGLRKLRPGQPPP